jgi:hypothetical protein
LPPSLQEFVLRKEYDIAAELAKVRSRERMHPYFLGMTCAITGFMYRRRHPYTAAMLLPISLIGMSWLYHRSLGYGNMMSRVMIEANFLLKDRYYQLTDDDILDVEQTLAAIESGEYKEEDPTKSSIERRRQKV